MIRQATGTLLARVHSTAMNLLTVMLAGHVLGGAGLGAISLIVLGITLLMLGAGFIGGAMVYLVPRTDPRHLLRPAYLCAAAGALAGYALLRAVPLVPPGTEVHVAILTFLQALYTAHFAILVGRQHIARHNLLTAFQGTLLLVVFAALTPSGTASINDYIAAAYASFSATVLLSGWAVLQLMRTDAPDAPADLRGLMRQGFWVTGANALQLVNYRFAYALVDRLAGTAMLGVYSVGNQLAESAWLAPRSLGLVLLSQVSNERDPQERTRLTLTALKLALTAATATLCLLLAIPGSVYTAAFGKDVTGLRPILLLLAPGILAMAASQAFSHYFSGIGRSRMNMLASGCGMAITVLVGPWAVALHGTHGAAATASLAYLMAALLQFVAFLRATRAPFAHFWPNAQDVQQARVLMRRLLGAG